MAKYLQLNFQIDGQEQLSRGIKGVKDSCESLEEAFNEIVKEFHKTEENRFEASGKYENLGKWASLTESYQDWKIKHVGFKPILTLYGNLRQSLTQRNFTSDVGGSIVRVSKMNLEIGTSVYYAMYHQRGTKKMRKRPPIELTDEQKKRWIQIIRLALVGQIENRAVQKYRTKGDSTVRSI